MLLNYGKQSKSMGLVLEEGVHARSCIRKTVQGNGQSARQASVDRGKIYFADRAAFKGRAVALEMVAAVRFRASCGRPGNDRAWRRPPGHGPQQSRPRWRSLRDTPFVGGNSIFEWSRSSAGASPFHAG